MNIVANRLAQNEQKQDTDAMEETTLQRISREAALEIMGAYLTDTGVSVNSIASIIYTHFRNGKEL